MNVRAHNYARSQIQVPHIVSKFVNLLPCTGGFGNNKAASLVHFPLPWYHDSKPAFDKADIP
jgi:hypothetical protein